jgi:hypothetical protein
MDAEAPNQPILVYNMEVEMILRPYYFGPNGIIPIPRKQNFDGFNPSDFFLESEQELVASFSRASENAEVIWLVVHDDHCPAAEKYNTSEERGYIKSCKILNDFLSKHYSIISTQQFYESSIRRLEKVSD